LAVIALVLGIAICLPGFLAVIGAVALSSDVNAPTNLARIPDVFGQIYNFAWFASFGVSFVTYLVLMAVRGTRIK
jgi:nucleobase:cation symporter-1, NCS1 family